ncbi:hypothetical protein [Fibrobacter sp. UWP2]|uniref:hypothetical protein n=1 Tax=Fibrobacter sp. UWP2 TaxID=1896216 RepID=UPI000913C877|nr:hypothetical protein [Fibrobacter sp. UWP2]SHI61191.1 hypothetical protein SAMN05720471_10490 [Fibrobacter sp. UWP2]
MFNKFSFAVGALFAVFVTACSGNDAGDIAGGTIDPNTVAENNSSSDAADIESSNSADVVLSSSEKKVLSSSSSRDANDGSHTIRIESSSSGRSAIESSSSCEGCGNGIDPIDISSSSSELRDGDIAHAGDFSIQCLADVINVDMAVPVVAPDVAGPEAFKHVDGDSVKFVLQNVYFAIPCEEDARKQFLQGVNEGGPVVSSEGDRLYVNFSRSKGWDYGCECVAKATFTLGKAYSGINYTVFDQKETLPVQEN